MGFPSTFPYSLVWECPITDFRVRKGEQGCATKENKVALQAAEQDAVADITTPDSTGQGTERPIAHKGIKGITMGALIGVSMRLQGSTMEAPCMGDPWSSMGPHGSWSPMGLMADSPRQADGHGTWG